MYSTDSARFSTKPKTWSNLVVNRFKAVKIPPLGPSLYLSFISFEIIINGEASEKELTAS